MQTFEKAKSENFYKRLNVQVDIIFK